MREVRSYNRLVNDIINLQIPFRVDIIGYVQYEHIYPILMINRISKMAKKSVVISSGQHGDEYFAVHVLLKWLQKFDPKLLDDFNITIFPVVNPFGYATNSRRNGHRQDTNSDKNFFKNSPVAELSILFDNFPTNPDLIMDVHGETDKDFVHAYERKADDLPSIATQALIDNDSILPYARNKTIWKVAIGDGGVINTPDQDVGIEGALEKIGTEYTIALELPGRYNGQKRTAGGIAILNSILTNFKETIK
jgi:hypothetical protein